MSLKRMEYYTIICDTCGVSADHDTDYAAWVDIADAEESAEGAEFQTRDDKHFCPDHYEVDGDE